MTDGAVTTVDHAIAGNQYQDQSMNIRAPIIPISSAQLQLAQPATRTPSARSRDTSRGHASPRPCGPEKQATRRQLKMPKLSARARKVLIRNMTNSEREALFEPLITEYWFLRIATRCTRVGLLMQHGADLEIVDEIEAWLKARRRGFREYPATLQDALSQAIGHITAMLEGTDPDAFLAAYVELPKLNISLAAAVKPTS